MSLEGFGEIIRTSRPREIGSVMLKDVLGYSVHHLTGISAALRMRMGKSETHVVVVQLVRPTALGVMPEIDVLSFFFILFLPRKGRLGDEERNALVDLLALLRGTIFGIVPLRKSAPLSRSEVVTRHVPEESHELRTMFTRPLG
jgi:hypothetical protein